jgi:hypothetical protein
MEQFESYLTYEDYQELGGTLPLDAFTRYERKAQRWLDYVTFNRVKHLTVVPNEVREVLAEFIGRLDDNEQRKKSGDILKQYSNGVEQLTFVALTESDMKKELYKLAQEWLPDYLTYRGVNFDVREYLQRNRNDSE